MSQSSWITSLGRLNYASGILAQRGDEVLALSMLELCVERLEAAVYDRTSAPLGVSMSDLYVRGPARQGPDAEMIFANYTLAKPCPDKVAPSGNLASKRKMSCAIAVDYTVAHGKHVNHTKSSGRGSVESAP